MNVIRCTLLFLFVFGVPLKGLPFNTSKLVFLILVVLFFIKNPARPTIAKPLGSILISFFTITCICLVITLSHNAKDTLFLYTILLNFVEHLIGSILFCLIFYHKDNAKQQESLFERDVIKICVIQSLIIISSLFLQPVSDFFVSLNREPEDVKDLLRRYYGLRGHGFASGLTFDLSVVLAFGVIYLNKNSMKLIFPTYYLVLIILISSMMIAGRTGIVFVILYLILTKFQNIRFYISAFAILMLTVVVSSVFLDDASEGPISSTLRFALEPILNFGSGSGLGTASTDRLFEMWSVVKDVQGSTIIQGDGYWRDPMNPNKYYMRVDAGFLRVIFYGGVFFALSIYFIWFLTIVMSVKMTRHYVVVSILFLLVETKGSFIFGSGMTAKILYLGVILHIATLKKTNTYRVPRMA